MKGFKLISCEVWVLQRWVTPPLPIFSHYSSSNSEWGYAYISAHMCVSVLTCVCEFAFVALCPLSMLSAYGFYSSKNFKQQLFVALKDSISLGSTLGMCVVWFVQLWRSRQNLAGRRTGYQLYFLIICSVAYQQQIRELSWDSLFPHRCPACQPLFSTTWYRNIWFTLLYIALTSTK